MIEGFPLTQLQLYVFLYALEGRCQFDGDEWRCGGPEFPYAKKILTSMGIPQTDQEKVFEICKEQGEEAVEMFKFLSDKPKVILMDHRMPEKTGIEAAKEILRIDKKVKIIFISA